MNATLADTEPSPAPADDRPQEGFTHRVASLLKEFSAKLRRTREQFREFADKASYDRFYYPGREKVIRAEVAATEEWYRRFRPAGEQLARDVSGMIDQGRLDPLERVELQLRLAEFEAELTTLPEIIKIHRES